ncbi:hypothetical protein AYR55_10585 [Loigolactobacillus backii]|uniref:organic hydroperoxide resistance protein n=1 Tax=Loigolactobacillus backii TaxID=375175 RepID=UPI0007F0E67F|nr:organic hydroperoxide resistance protein [Loigolactobacillus backii]ANK68093.1 hypothetical protein AYR55_10585 [Loigolactobacillus backii]
MNKLYTTVMTNEGGREGQVWSNDKKLDLKITAQGEGKEGTNPEQLFAAGYASCFNSALSVALEQGNVSGKSTIRAEVSLFQGDGPDFKIAVKLIGHIDGLDKEEAAKYMQIAHQICPYSKATSGNVDVELVTE